MPALEDVKAGVAGLLAPALGVSGIRLTSLFQGAAVVASRSGNIGAAVNTSSSSLSNGTDTSGVTRIKHLVFEELADVRLVYANVAHGAAGPNLITVRAGLELTSSIILPVLFGGKDSVDISPGGFVVSDPVAIPAGYPRGTVVHSRTHVAVTSGGKFPHNCIASNSNEGYQANGAASLATSGTIPNAFIFGYGPVAMIGGLPSAVPNVAIVGDSIAAGQGDSSSGDGTDYGFIARALHAARIGYVQVAKPGETASTLVGPATFSRRFVAVSGCGIAIVQYGINDVNAGRTLAQIQADLLTLWTTMARRGMRAYQTTITPSATSSNTVPAANDTVRRNLNNWLRAGAPIDPTTKAAVAVGTAGALVAGATGHPLSGFFEVADIAETARDSGLWKADYTTDGTHPSATGHAALAAGIVTSALTL